MRGERSGEVDLGRGRNVTWTAPIYFYPLYPGGDDFAGQVAASNEQRSAVNLCRGEKPAPGSLHRFCLAGDDLAGQVAMCSKQHRSRDLGWGRRVVGPGGGGSGRSP